MVVVGIHSYNYLFIYFCILKIKEDKNMIENKNKFFKGFTTSEFFTEKNENAESVIHSLPEDRFHTDMQ